MAEFEFDVVEQILLRLDVKDLIRCKSVCKSWDSLISTPRFAKAHYLNQTYINDRKPRKIVIPGISFFLKFYEDLPHVVGSSNGLVCISIYRAQLLVVNPSTAEVNEQLPLIPKELVSSSVCGFGYDSSTDDYKVIIGFRKVKGEIGTYFYVLTLKSNIWKLIGEVNYKFIDSSRPGILRNGSLHWFMNDKHENKVILSLDLSTEEFKETPQPDDLLYGDSRLGVIKDCLCIFDYSSSSKIWVMKNYNVKQSWELLPKCEFEEEYDGAAVHCLTVPNQYFDHKLDFIFPGRCFVTAGDYIAAPTFVQSLISPHGNKERLAKPRRNIKGLNFFSCMEMKIEAPIHVAKKEESGETAMRGSQKRKSGLVRRLRASDRLLKDVDMLHS